MQRTAQSRTAIAASQWFFVSISLAAALAVIAGFFPTFFRPLAAGEYSAGPLLHVHAATFFAWTALFVVQPLLVRLGHRDRHRALGTAGAVLIVAMVLTGTGVALSAAARGVATGDPDAYPFLLVTLTDMLLFAVLAGSAIVLRRQPHAHKRLMVLATAALLPAAFGRLSWFALGIEHPLAMHVGANLLLLAGIAHDLWAYGRVHAAYLWGGALLVGVHASRMLVWDTPVWTGIAEWIVGLL